MYKQKARTEYFVTNIYYNSLFQLSKSLAEIQTAVLQLNSSSAPKGRTKRLQTHNVLLSSSQNSVEENDGLEWHDSSTENEIRVLLYRSVHHQHRHWRRRNVIYILSTNPFIRFDKSSTSRTIEPTSEDSDPTMK